MDSSDGDRTILNVSALAKKFHNHTIFENVNFICHAGEVIVLLGQNGSGKTTLLSCIAGLRSSDAGTVRVCDADLYSDEITVRRQMAFVPDVPQFYLELTACEHLQFMAAAHQASSAFEGTAPDLLRELDLWDVRHQFPHTYSRGMRQKLGLAMALVRPFSLLVMDEPTSALDNESVGWLFDRLDRLVHEHKGIVISTHDDRILQRFPNSVYRLSNGTLSRS